MEQEIIIKVVVDKGGKIAAPKCDNALRFCRLVKREWLMPEEVKIIELLGFKIKEIYD